jgi:hypothetical protein
VSESKSSEGRCPGAESATVATSKLTGYLLNPDPEVSGGKSAVFIGIGYTASNADQLRDVFISGLQGATATPGIPNGGGGVKLRCTDDHHGAKRQRGLPDDMGRKPGRYALGDCLSSEEERNYALDRDYPSARQI